MPHRDRIVARCLLVVSVVAFGAEEIRATASEAREVVLRAMAEAVAVPAQAEALAALAWGPGTGDPLVRAEARAELVRFGHNGLPALRAAIRRVDPRYQADVTRALIDARRQQRAGNPPDFLPGLEEAIWFGSIEARRLAMQEIGGHLFPPAVLSTIDAIHEHPELTLQGLRTLGELHDPRGRFFLKRVLDLGEPEEQRVAAVALGELGEVGVIGLREKARADDPRARAAAIEALLPLAVPDDLTLLQEYVAEHADDDPALLARLRERVVALERELEERQLSEGASSKP